MPGFRFKELRARPQFTDHCFTGEYPTPLTDRTTQDAPLSQLSLLADAS